MAKRGMLTEDEFNKEIKKLMNMSKDKLFEIANDDTQPAYRMLIASMLLKSINRGSVMQLNILLERLFGKPFTKEIDTSDIPTKIEIKFKKYDD
jgi:hypothetical protein